MPFWHETPDMHVKVSKNQCHWLIRHSFLYGIAFTKSIWISVSVFANPWPVRTIYFKNQCLIWFFSNLMFSDYYHKCLNSIMAWPFFFFFSKKRWDIWGGKPQKLEFDNIKSVCAWFESLGALSACWVSVYGTCYI